MQTTLRQSAAFSGVGLHSGAAARMWIRPAPAGAGILFRRIDVTDRDPTLPARHDRVVDTRLCTQLGNEAGVRLSTVEHVMAALAGLGVDNARVDVDGPEAPILDGSAAPFARRIREAGLTALAAPRRRLRVLAPVTVSDGAASATLRPSDRFEIDFEIEFPDQAIGRQRAAFAIDPQVFASELADCRTFTRRAEVEALRAAGLARGGDLSNAVVVDGAAVLSPGGFRRADECVRHKILDAVGDLALAGGPILGRYEGVRAGHGLTNRLLRALFATPGAVVWEDEAPALSESARLAAE